MTASVLQTIALLLACFGVWKLCLHLRASAPRRTFLIIAGGFLFRVFAGSALFWISYLGLPIGRRLQTGRGFWFFAFDGMGYFDLASTFASKGLLAIAAVPSNSPSPFYVQILALFEYTFGIVASIGILLNVICYLITASVLVWLSRRDARLTTPVNVALLVLSFAPGCALWSLQPLKDSFFVCVLTLFVAVCVAWQELWSGEARRVWPRALALAAATFALVYAISSVRWYTAFAIWVTLPLFAIAIARLARRRAAAFFATAALMIVSGQAILMASSGYLPRPLAALLGSAGPRRQKELARLDLVKWLDSVRRGYDRTPGGTAITAGTLVPAQKPPEPPQVAVAAASPAPAPASASTSATATAKPAEAKTVYEELVTADRARQSEQQSARMPVTRSGRIITGVAATFLPRALAQSLGLINVEGGRGFWLVADADTIVLDALVIFVIVFCVRQLRAKRMRVAPAMVLVFVSMLAIAGPMIYTVSNFGTLFRLRQIIALQLCLIPLVMSAAPRREPAFDAPESAL